MAKKQIRDLEDVKGALYDAFNALNEEAGDRKVAAMNQGSVYRNLAEVGRAIAEVESAQAQKQQSELISRVIQGRRLHVETW